MRTVTVKKCQAQVCGFHRLQDQKVFRSPAAAPGHLIFLRWCFANSSPRGTSSSPFHLSLFDRYVSLHFVEAFQGVQALCCSLLKHFHWLLRWQELHQHPLCWTATARFSVALNPFIPSQAFAYKTDVCTSSLAPPLAPQPCLADLWVAGFPRGQAQQCKSAPKPGMQLILSQFRGLEQQHALHFFRKGPGIWEEGRQWHFLIWTLLETPCEPACPGNQWDWFTKCQCYTKGTTNAT